MAVKINVGYMVCSCYKGRETGVFRAHKKMGGIMDIYSETHFKQLAALPLESVSLSATGLSSNHLAYVVRQV